MSLEVLFQDEITGLTNSEDLMHKLDEGDYLSCEHGLFMKLSESAYWRNKPLLSPDLDPEIRDDYPQCA